MGQSVVRPYTKGWEDIPFVDEVPSFDPNLGFPEGRKERVSVATLEEMRSANIPERLRDYCAHKLIQCYVCQKKHFPMFTKCEHERHEYDACLRDDFLIRMMEVERERRLRLRKKKMEAAAQAEILTA
ncbi:NADH dehydrogenase (ubiquinone) B18 subunit [Lasioglossum baleicum]|uniref:NADH dehydrogenase (ubiquinone) B18 subunit n=1 Tax=Lasioglossum baleicum TaxID=434251 RepID=UPI003FCC389B